MRVSSWTLACCLLPAALGGSLMAAEVARWEPGGFAGGTWTDTVAGLPATTGSGVVTATAEGVVFDGLSNLQVAGAQSPVAGLTTFSMTARFRVVQGATGTGKDPNNGAHFWANASLVGRELPGGARGDYNLAINSENELVAGWGNPDGGFVDSVALNDGAFHTATATFNQGTSTVTLYRDGVLAGSVVNGGLPPEFETMNIGVNILGVPNDLAYLNGTISHVVIHNTELSAGEVTALHGSLVIPEPGTFMLAAIGLLGLVAPVIMRRRRGR